MPRAITTIDVRNGCVAGVYGSWSELALRCLDLGTEGLIAKNDIYRLLVLKIREGRGSNNLGVTASGITVHFSETAEARFPCLSCCGNTSPLVKVADGAYICACCIGSIHYVCIKCYQFTATQHGSVRINHERQHLYYALCEGCIRNFDYHLAFCFGCRSLLPAADAKGGLCVDCARAGALVPYSTDVIDGLGLRLDTSRSKERKVGVELEVIAPLTVREQLRNEIGDFAMLKADSSLGPDGVEIVTIPLTLDEHWILWKGVFDGVLKSCMLTDRCGMHVHLARPGELNLAKMLRFINRPSNSNLVNKAAGRLQNEYCYRVAPLSLAELLSTNRGAVAHHSALNISSRTRGQTVELRIFKSTTDFNEFMGMLEFAFALNHFVNSLPISGMRADEFKAWLSRTGKSYKYLRALLGLGGWPKVLPSISSCLKRGKKIEVEFRGVKRGSKGPDDDIPRFSLSDVIRLRESAGDRSSRTSYGTLRCRSMGSNEEARIRAFNTVVGNYFSPLNWLTPDHDSCAADCDDDE